MCSMVLRYWNVAKRFTVAGFLLSALIGVGWQSASAQTGLAVPLTLPSQPLDKTLVDLADRTGVTIIAPAPLVAGKVAPALNGTYTPEQAVRLVLAGSGLTSEIDARGAILVRALPAGGSGPIVIPPIIVTGERQARSLQDTASSVRVLDEDEIRRGPNDSVYNAIQTTPNLTPTLGTSLPSIRGTDSDGPLGLGSALNNQPRAVLIVDDVARVPSNPNNNVQSLFDVEQVEVFRGPQSTGRGANAVGGAFVVKTKDPEFELGHELFFEPTWDEFSGIQYRAAGMTNLPLVEDILSTRLVIEYDDRDVPAEVREVPGGAAFAPGTDLDRLTEGRIASIRNKWLFEPNGLPGLSVLAAIEHQKAVTGLSDDERIIAFADTINNTKAWAYTANASYDLSGWGEFKSITSLQRDRFDNTGDSPSTLSIDRFKRHRVSQELLYDLSGDERPVTGVIGLFYARDKTDVETSGSFPQLVDAKTRSYAVFFDGGIHLMPSVRLLAGARLQRYENEIQATILGFPTLDDTSEEDVFLPMLGLQVDLAESHTVSVTGRRGYNPGGVSVNVGVFPFAASTFDSEFVDTFEVTYRGGFLDDTVTMGLTGFLNHFDDKQFFFRPTPTTNTIINFNEARSYGLEFEATVRPTDDLTIGFGLGVLETEITDAGGDSMAINGNEFGQDPNLTLSANVVWIPTDSLEFSASAQYVSEYESTFSNTDGQEAGDYALVDIGAAYTYEPFTVRAFVRNLFDEFAVTNRFATGLTVLPPRTIGLSGSVRF